MKNALIILLILGAILAALDYFVFNIAIKNNSEKNGISDLTEEVGGLTKTQTTVTQTRE